MTKKEQIWMGAVGFVGVQAALIFELFEKAKAQNWRHFWIDMALIWGSAVVTGAIVMEALIYRRSRGAMDPKDEKIKALEAENQKLKIERRGFQIMARRMMDGVDPGFWQAAMEDGKYERAGGDVECTACRQTYVEHPQLPRFPTFHMLCSGDIVKT